jgi:Protein of unknown function (DUF2971)
MPRSCRILSLPHNTARLLFVIIGTDAPAAQQDEPRRNTGLKIWRYVDLAKFVNMVATGTLRFTCLLEFKDPYEGWIPRSYMAAFRSLAQTHLDQIQQTRDAIATRFPDRDPAQYDHLVPIAQRRLDMTRLLREANAMFGASCWHINDGESEAMWQLYASAGSGIAIESTKDRLEAALQNECIQIDRVRYRNFDDDPIEKDHRHYIGFLKRPSFAHEQELRAVIKLPTPGSGTSIPCDMDALIARIVVAPGAPAFYGDTVRWIVDHAKLNLGSEHVVNSRLLDPPDY